MKQLIFLSILLSLLSCSNESRLNESNCQFSIESNDEILDLNMIGLYHNDFLDHNIQSFNESNISTESKEEFLKSFYSEVSVNSNGLTYSNITMSNEFILDNSKCALIEDYIFHDLSTVENRFIDQLNYLNSNNLVTTEEYILIKEFWFDLNNDILKSYDYYKTKWCNTAKNESLGIISGSLISIGYNSFNYWVDFENNSLNISTDTETRAAPFLVAAADTAGALEGIATYTIANGISGFNDGLGGELVELGIAITVGAGVNSVAGWFKAVKWAKRAWDWY